MLAVHALSSLVGVPLYDRLDDLATRRVEQMQTLALNFPSGRNTGLVPEIREALLHTLGVHV